MGKCLRHRYAPPPGREEDALIRPRRGQRRMATEREKMLAGELYLSADPELVLARRRARDLLRAFNGSRDEEHGARRQVLGELLGAVGEGAWIEPPFSCDYGRNITLGDRVYFNFNCVILDCAAVTIGDDVFFAPNVQVYAA